MRPRLALGLASLAALAGVSALALSGTGDEVVRSDLPRGQLAFPDLALAQSQRIEITHRGATLVLARAESGWVLPQHAGFPVRPQPVQALLSGLDTMRLLEPRTADPNRFARLGVQDPGGADAPGTAVRVLGAGGAPLAAMILGNREQAGLADDGFVRAPDAGQAWLAAGPPDASADWRDWIDPAIIDVLPEQVAAVTVRHGDGTRLVFARQDGALRLTEPAGAPPLDRFRIDDLAAGLSDLTLHDVAPAAAMPGTPAGQTTLTTPAGLAMTVSISLEGTAAWARMRASGTAEAAALDRRLAPWAFRIDAQRAAALLPHLADLAAYAPPAPPAAPPHTRRR